MSWATIIGAGVGAAALVVTAVSLIVTVRKAVSDRQRKLRGQLREVLRSISEACDDYAYADRRIAASARLREAAERLKVIHDEGILSPNQLQIHNLERYVYGLATQVQASANFVAVVGSMVAAEERERLKENQEHNTKMLLRYVSRLSAKYRHVTTKMDNGHIATYLHYRLLPPFIVRR